MRFPLLILFLLSALLAPAQTFMRSYGGVGGDNSRSITLTPDSGFAILGVSNSYTFGSNDLYLVRTDKWGDTLWTRNYGGTGNEIAASVALCSDSGFVVAGTTNSFGTGTPTYTNWYVVRTNKFGDTLWTKTYDGMYSNDLMFHARENQDGSFIFQGYQDIGGYAKGTVIKTNSSGYPLWTTYVGSSSGSHSYESMELPSGEYITCNSTFSGTYNVVVQKLSAGGALLLSNNIHSSGSYADAAFTLVPAFNGGYMALGIYGNYGSYNVWLLRMNDNLDTLWTRRLPGQFTVSQLWTKDVSLSRVNDGYVICGTYFNATSSDIKLLKVDSLGNVIWTRYHGGPNEQYGFKAIVTPDQGIAACGYNYVNNTDLQFFLIKTDSSGNIAATIPPMANAGPNGAICAGDSFLLSGASASNYNTLRWTSSGSGYFSDTTLLNPRYFPSQADITAGSVILTLRAIALGHPAAISTCTLTIHPLPQVHISGLDTAYCLGSYSVNATGLPAGGVFSGTGISSSGVFNVGLAGIGSVLIRYNYSSAAGCAGRDSVTVHVRPIPDISLINPVSQGICPGDSIGLTLIGGGGNMLSWFCDGVLIPGAGDTSIYVQMPGQYRAVAINNYGCSDSTGVVSVYQHPLPQLSLGPDTILCAGDVLTLAPGASYSFYAWSTGSSAQTIQLDSTGHGLQPFDIWLSVWNQFSCEASDSIRIQFLDCSGLDEGADSRMVVYPNPSTGQLFLKMSGIESKAVTIRLLDLLGRELMLTKYESGPLDLSHLPKGGYILVINSDTQTHTIPIILE